MNGDPSPPPLKIASAPRRTTTITTGATMYSQFSRRKLPIGSLRSKASIPRIFGSRLEEGVDERGDEGGARRDDEEAAHGEQHDDEGDQVPVASADHAGEELDDRPEAPAELEEGGAGEAAGEGDQDPPGVGGGDLLEQPSAAKDEREDEPEHHGDLERRLPGLVLRIGEDPPDAQDGPEEGEDLEPTEGRLLLGGRRQARSAARRIEEP